MSIYSPTSVDFLGIFGFFGFALENDSPTDTPRRMAAVQRSSSGLVEKPRPSREAQVPSSWPLPATAVSTTESMEGASLPLPAEETNNRARQFSSFSLFPALCDARTKAAKRTHQGSGEIKSSSFALLPSVSLFSGS